ncbi:Protein TRC8, partial [Schistosoma japonicum]
STLSLLRTRLFVGLFVHGSETWLSVCGAAAFFGVLATVFVSILVFILDPSGDGTARLAMVVADAPADPHAWNVIDDPALALDQNDVIAVELLASTGWNCAVVFLFLAFQSDMPNSSTSLSCIVLYVWNHGTSYRMHPSNSSIN